MGVLTQHVGHHECGQLRVGVGVEQAVVRQGMEGVTRLVLHEVQQRWVGVVRWCDGRNLIVFITSSSTTTTIAASALTGVALERQRKIRNQLYELIFASYSVSKEVHLSLYIRKTKGKPWKTLVCPV